jgi:hypothetical protein
LALSASKAERVSPRVEFDRQSLENPSTLVIPCASLVSSAFLAVNAGDLWLLDVVESVVVVVGSGSDCWTADVSGSGATALMGLLLISFGTTIIGEGVLGGATTTSGAGRLSKTNAGEIIPLSGTFGDDSGKDGQLVANVSAIFSEEPSKSKRSRALSCLTT